MDSIHERLAHLKNKLNKENNPQKRHEINSVIHELQQIQLENNQQNFANQNVSFSESGCDQDLDYFVQNTGFNLGDLYYDIQVQQFNDRIKNFKYHNTIKMKGNYKIDLGLWQTLKMYQQDGVKWLLSMHFKNNGCLLADEPGLGKTVQTIAFLSAIFYENSQQSVILVCPATLVEQWAAMLQQWQFQIRVCIVNTKAADQTGSKNIPHLLNLYTNDRNSAINFGSIYLISYHQIHNNIREMSVFVQEMRIKTAIFDEVHIMKNRESKLYRVLKQLPIQQRVGLSGTPIQNNFFEIFSILDFLQPNCLGTYDMFKQRYIDVIAKGQNKSSNSQQVVEAIRMAKQLTINIKPFILRRLKRNVEQQLPPKFEYLAKLSLSQIQENLYQKCLSRGKSISIKNYQSNIQLFSFFQELQQIVNHPILYENQQYFTIRQSAKCEFLVDKLSKLHNFIISQQQLDSPIFYDAKLLHQQDDEISFLVSVSDDELISETQDGEQVTQYIQPIKLDISRNKSLVFSSSVTFLKLIARILSFLQIKFLYMDGATPVTNRNQLVEQFNAGECDIFLLSSKVGGVGLNLIAANYIFIMQPHWNPSVDQQSLERSWRIGQTRLVSVYRVVCGSTIDERILKKQIIKKNLSEKVLNNAFMSKDFQQNDTLFQIFQYSRPAYKKQILVHEKINEKSRDLVQDALSEDLQLLVKKQDSKLQKEQRQEARIEEVTNKLIMEFPLEMESVFDEFEDNEVIKGIYRVGILNVINPVAADAYSGFAGYKREVDHVKAVVEQRKSWIVSFVAGI